MKAILVDDEILALERLEKMLKNDTEDITVVGTCSNPLKVEIMVKQLQPDIIFLDIEMPELNGLQLAERIQEAYPEIEIVFVTAFDRYAVQAFELYAIDYIMKPIRLERLQTTIQRLQTRLAEDSKTSNSKNKTSHYINFFHKLNVQFPDSNTETIKWRTAKAQELFTYMLHHRNQVIYRDTILELLWPDFDISRGSKQLYTTIYHIRQMLKKLGLDDMTISRQPLDSGYRLDAGSVLIDTELWEGQIKNNKPLSLETLDEHEQIFHAYKGHYLEKYDYIWAEGERERLRRLWLSQAESLHTFYFEHNMINAAIAVNERVQQLSATEEVSYFNLMKLYDSLNNAIVVEAQYEKLIKMMEEKLDTKPNDEITVWYKQWQAKKAIEQHTL